MTLQQVVADTGYTRSSTKMATETPWLIECNPIIKPLHISFAIDPYTLPDTLTPYKCTCFTGDITIIAPISHQPNPTANIIQSDMAAVDKIRGMKLPKQLSKDKLLFTSY